MKIKNSTSFKLSKFLDIKPILTYNIITGFDTDKYWTSYEIDILEFCEKVNRFIDINNLQVEVVNKYVIGYNQFQIGRTVMVKILNPWLGRVIIDNFDIRFKLYNIYNAENVVLTDVGEWVVRWYYKIRWRENELEFLDVGSRKMMNWNEMIVDIDFRDSEIVDVQVFLNDVIAECRVYSEDWN